jgi:putative lipoic acid-binding regulatory protein
MSEIKIPQQPNAPATLAVAAKESIMQFPCDVPVTAIGVRVDGLAQAISVCVSGVIASFDASTIEMRPSKAGTYLAVAFSVHAISMAQLEQLNEALKAHPLVKYVL